MKLTESQSESFELLYASVCNGLLYAEVLGVDLKAPMHPVLVKFKWLKSYLESRIPQERRAAARGKDHMFYDELLRCATHMNEEQKQKLEEFIRCL